MIFRDGDRVRVKNASSGAYGAIGKTGTLIADSRCATNGLSSYTKNKVRIDDGSVWGLGPQAEFEMVEAYRDTVTHLEDNNGVKVGIGGAPTRATILPRDPQARKMYPVASGFMDYFPDAICAVANLSHVGNEQHNPGQPLHWARNKSRDEADTMLRHFLQRGTRDEDGVRHSVKMVWRALALLQKELEEEPASASSEPPPTQSGQLLGVSVPRPHSRYQDQPSGVQ